MVTIARCIARQVSLVMLMLFAVGPAGVLAGPQLDPDAASAIAPQASEAPSLTGAAPARLFAASAWSGFRPTHEPPQWLAATATASTPAKSESWWSRRTTAQKTWIIVGMVAGAYGIYALASNDSGDDGGGGY
jgi:hypothetical protein